MTKLLTWKKVMSGSGSRWWCRKILHSPPSIDTPNLQPQYGELWGKTTLENQLVQTFASQGSQKEKKGAEKLLEEIMAKNFPTQGGTGIQIQKAQSSKKDEPRETYTKTQCN